ncbi:MAG: TolC family protein [Candidatus Aminicenantes bacterium]|nr:TolC family protein [Candidatus Aminicenantes bacterium]
MKKTLKVLSLLLIFSFLSGLALLAQEEKVLKLTLEDCIIRTLKNNLGVSIQELNPEISAASLSKAKEKFYPTLQFSYTQRRNNTPSFSGLESIESTITKYNDLYGQISQAIPFGGTLNISLDTYKNFTTQNFQTWNPRYYSTLRFDFTQPLLQNFGYNMSRKEIIIARNNLAASQAQLEKSLMDTIYSAEQAYWNLVYAIEDLKVKQQSLKLAQELLEKNIRSVEVGTLAPLDVLSARSEVATREADIIQAEAAVKNAEDQLKTLMNMSQEEEKQYTAIIPVDTPKFEQKEMSLEEAISIALANRPDLKSLQINLKTQEFNLSVAKNQLLPALNLTASYWSPGLSGDRLVYLNNNPLTGIIVDVIPGPRSNSLKDALNFKYQNWSVGLTLNIPLSNMISKASYTQARLNLEQAQLSLKQQEQQAMLEIKTALRNVQANLKRVQAYRAARELQEQKLAAEEEKLKVGQSTNYTVLMYQRDLANARSAELKAIIDYNISLANLEKALGLSLKNRNMKLVDFLDSN